MATNVVIFGAGQGGQRVARVLPSGYRLLAFADNDQKKHGDSLFGKPILAPQRLTTGDVQYDTIIVASQYAREICSQLHKLGVAKDQIELVEDDVLGGAYEFDTRGVALKTGGVVLITAALIIALYFLTRGGA